MVYLVENIGGSEYRKTNYVQKDPGEWNLDFPLITFKKRRDAPPILSAIRPKIRAYKDIPGRFSGESMDKKNKLTTSRIHQEY